MTKPMSQRVGTGYQEGLGKIEQFALLDEDGNAGLDDVEIDMSEMSE